MCGPTRHATSDTPTALPAGEDRGHGSDRTGTTWHRARELAHAAAVPGPPVTVALDAAAGATLADDLRTLTSLPAFDSAAMDGYAVAGSPPYRIVGQVRAGEVWPSDLSPGDAVGISTGAQVPTGADAVVPIEDADVSNSMLSCPPRVRVHVRRAGEDARPGDVLAAGGTFVGPALLGLAASCGHDTLTVRARPGVRVLVTGDELRRSGPSGDGRTRDALGPMLPTLLERLGGTDMEIRPVADRPAGGLFQAVADAVDDAVAVIVVTGSTSVGVTDQLRTVLSTRQARWIVDTVRCRPGRPQVLARLAEGPYVVGLPGNPYAALVGVYTLLAPLLAGLAGRTLPTLPQARMVADVVLRGETATVVPVIWDGAVVARIAGSGSAFLRGAALAEALAVVPPGWRSGELVSLVGWQ